MPGVKNGAELIQKLAQTGTGENKLIGPRKFLEDVHRIEGRVASATEVYAVMEGGQYEVSGQKVYVPASPEATLIKARELLRTGEWNGVSQEKEATIEEKLLGLKPSIEKVEAPPASPAIGVTPVEKPVPPPVVGPKKIARPLKADLKMAVSEAKE